jgi:pimeloyl-ACP methyl ester carboxylesterase
MQLISAALVDGGFDVYNIDLPGHGDSAAGFEAGLAREALRAVVAEIRPRVVLGHSLGAGLLLDLAVDQHFSTMVLLSAAPTPVPEIQADRVLLITGAYDIGRIRRFASLVNDLGSNTHIESWDLPWAAHSSAIFNPMHIHRIVEWLGGKTNKIRTTSRILAILGMLISVVVLGWSALPSAAVANSAGEAVSRPATVVRYIGAAGASILILRFFVPLAWLRLFATDYMVSFLLLTGLILCLQMPKWSPPKFVNVAKATTAAAFVIGLGLIAVSPVLHMSLSNGRWWRFPVIAAAGLPLFLFDEMSIRQIRPRLMSFAIAVTTRAVLWAFLITGVLLLNREAAFLFLIAHLIVFFWIALWFGTYLVYRHSQDPFAAALFAAIVQGWAFAAWFVIR